MKNANRSDHTAGGKHPLHAAHTANPASPMSTPQTTGRFYYGWVLVIAFTLVMAAAYGANFAFSVFLKPISDWFAWDRATTSGPLAMALWLSGLLAVGMGLLTDRLGPRFVILLGVVAGVAGHLIISRTENLWHFYAGFAVTAVNTSSVWTPLVSTTARWFTRRRVLAIGIVTGGIGLGQMVIPPLANHLILNMGWQTAYAVIAAIIGVVSLPAVVLCRPAPSAQMHEESDSGSSSGAKTPPQQGMGFSMVVRTRPFWLLFSINVAQASILFMAGMHIAAHAVDTGIGASAAAFAITFMGGANVGAKLVAGGIASRRGSTFTLLLFITAETIALCIFAVARGSWMFYLGSALLGAGIGGATPPLAALIAEFFGLRSVGTITGLIGVGWAAGCALGTVTADIIFDATGSYFVAFLLGIGLAVAVGVMAASLRQPKARSQ